MVRWLGEPLDQNNQEGLFGFGFGFWVSVDLVRAVTNANFESQRKGYST